MVSTRRSICLGLFIAALGLGAPSTAGSQAPDPEGSHPVTGQGAQGQGISQQAASDQRTTAPAPEGAAVDPDGGKSATKAKADYDEANLEVQRRIADYTEQSVRLTAQALSFTRWAIFLTVVESLLFVITTVFTVLAVIQAKRSADTAEKALAITDRPQVLIGEISIGNIAAHLAQPDAESKPLTFGYKLHNFGKGVAWITGREAFVRVGPTKEALPLPAPDLEKLLWPLPPTHWFGIEEKEGKGVRIEPDILQGIIDGSQRMYAIGGVTYRDEEGRNFTHSFIYEYALLADRFVPFDDDRYWVTKSDYDQQKKRPHRLRRLLSRLVPSAT